MKLFNIAVFAVLALVACNGPAVETESVGKTKQAAMTSGKAFPEVPDPSVMNYYGCAYISAGQYFYCYGGYNVYLGIEQNSGGGNTSRWNYGITGSEANHPMFLVPQAVGDAIINGTLCTTYSPHTILYSGTYYMIGFGGGLTPGPYLQAVPAPAAC